MMPEIVESSLIQGVQIVELKVFGDDRGRFMEVFRKEWFPQRTWNDIQTNCSISQQGVLRGLHYHFKQVDYWFASSGQIRAVLCDVRPDSPTFRAVQVLEMGDSARWGLYIPVGVAHGFVTLVGATLTYVVDNYYDGQDEFGVAWDDPDLQIPWEVEAPIVSGRDAANPRLKDIPPAKLPHLNG